jgi:hypothetical protein
MSSNRRSTKLVRIAMESLLAGVVRRLLQIGN